MRVRQVIIIVVNSWPELRAWCDRTNRTWCDRSPNSILESQEGFLEQLRHKKDYPDGGERNILGKSNCVCTDL